MSADGNKLENDTVTLTKHGEQTIAREKDKICIFKNVLIISFAFMLNFTAFNSMSNLQSSINKQLGTTSLWVVYASIIFSNFFLPSFVIKKIKLKWTMAVCMLCYSTYIAAQFYPRYYTLVPTAFILGLGAAPMWSALCTYLTQMGNIYATIVGEKSEVIITKFFGIFYLMVQMSQVWGNLISSEVLSSGIDNVTRSQTMLDTCGANYCPVLDSETKIIVNETESESVEEERVYHKIIILSSIYLVCSLLSVVIIGLLVDPLSRFRSDDETAISKKSGLQLIVATFTHMNKINQILLLPITIWSGFQEGFFAADFTNAFVTCSIGVHQVGYVFMCYGISNSISSLCFSHIVKGVGRVPIFTFGALLNVAILILMLNWTPNPDNIFVFFVMATCWGIADAVWQAQLKAFYGTIFLGDPESAFSNNTLWESVGYVFAYVCSGAICMAVKVYILLGLMVVAMTGYYVVEILEKIGGLKFKGKTIRCFTDFK